MDRNFEWKPLDFICDADKKFALVMLNGELRLDEKLLVHLWTKAALRLTVDGGTNLWLSFVDKYPNASEVIKPLMPDLVTGDFDSITPEALNRCKGVSHIEHTPNQDKTDFTKALEFMTSYLECKAVQVDYIIIVSETSGRIDQILSNINTLFTCEVEQTTKSVPIFMLSSNSLTWLLAEGKHLIHVPTVPKIAALFKKPDNNWLALLPVGQPCKVTTSGLKWNLSDGVLNFGGLISSSNTYGEEPVITVQTDHPLIWAMGLDASRTET